MDLFALDERSGTGHASGESPWGPMGTPCGCTNDLGDSNMGAYVQLYCGCCQSAKEYKNT
jgi:hypothetical protein